MIPPYYRFPTDKQNDQYMAHTKNVGIHFDLHHVTHLYLRQYRLYFRKREKRDRNNQAARTSRLRRKARESHLLKEAEALQQENEVLKDEVGELKKVLYTLQDEVRNRFNVVDVENVENVIKYENVDYTFHNQNL
ncbi:basic region leucine zipper [Cooperia oncophora]